jgi:peptidoglycan/xylan/chitin deacetylase (PgdA/CDA1 family)
MKRLATAIIAGFLIAVGLLLVGQHDVQQDTKEAIISITFDDGYVSEYNSAIELEEYGWHGVIYFPSGLAGGYFEGIPIMTWEHVSDLQNRGHEIGGHTLTHAKASNLSESEWESEIKQGKDLLEQHNITVESFAYPYNDINHTEITKKYYPVQRNVNGGINPINTNETELNGLALTHNNYQELLPIYLEDLKLNGGWLVLAIHDVSDNPRPDIDLSPEDLTSILEQIKQSKVPVKTIAEVENETKA